jgi:hypothetical protein
MNESVNARIDALLSTLPERRAAPLAEPVAALQAELKNFLARYQQPLERVFSENEVRELLSEALAQPTAIEESPSTSALNNAFESLSAADSQPAILKYLVGFLSRQYERVAIFMIREREQSAVGWLVRGFRTDDERKTVRKAPITLQNPSLLREVIDSGQPVILEQPSRNGLYQLLSVSAPARAVAWPLKLQNRVGVILYGDQVESHRELKYLKELELILPFAEKALEVHTLRARLAASTIAPPPPKPAPAWPPPAPSGFPAPAPSGPPSAFPARGPAALTPTLAEPTETPSVAAPSAEPLDLDAGEGPVTAIELQQPPPPGMEPFPAFAIYTPTAEPISGTLEELATPAPTTSHQEAQPPPSIAFYGLEPGSPQLAETPRLESEIPGPELEAPSPKAGASPEPEIPTPVTEALPDPAIRAMQDEARKFARLLVYEIKLYNEDKVEDGRRQGDLYSRLRLDIERSLEVYRERYPEPAIQSTHFDDYLVEILAGGKPELLGPRI